jgi:hypothetical protein
MVPHVWTYRQLFVSFFRILGLIYYIITLSYRVCFLNHITYDDPAAAGSIAVDYIVDAFFILDALAQQRNNFAIRPDSSLPAPQPLAFTANSSVSTKVFATILPGNSAGVEEQIVKKTLFQHFVEYVGYTNQFCCCFPFEIVGYLCSMNGYYYLRLFRIARTVYLYGYWDAFTEILEKSKISVNTGMHRLAFILTHVLILDHVFACVFHALAVNLLYRGNSNNWLTHDHHASIVPDADSDGKIVWHSGAYLRYIRAMYWSSATIAGVGYGDISAWAESETWFILAYFYVVVLVISLGIACLTMLITSNDSAKTDNRVKIIKFAKYASYRKLPSELTNRVLSYYEYQWQLLKGVDENKVSH